jgi:hypothetical protein
MQGTTNLIRPDHQRAIRGDCQSSTFSLICSSSDRDYRTRRAMGADACGCGSGTWGSERNRHLQRQRHLAALAR